MAKTYAQVAVDFPKRPSVLTYLINEEMQLERGDLVEVPLGRRKAKGCVLEINNEYNGEFEESKLKEIVQKLENSVQLKDADLKLWEWMSQYYHYSYGQLIFDCIPKFLKRPREVEWLYGEGEFENLTPSDEQSKIIEYIKPKIFSGFDRYYIHGITGSGKTFIYLQMIKEMIDKGKNVLFMIPEINLTPQFLKDFQKQLSCQILPYHSELSNSHKYSIWKKLTEEKGPFLVMGVRSSVFLPLSNLGLVIVDEEHDNSFKQSDRCTYNGRDVAIKKAQLANAAIILGSATPTIENYYNLKNNDHFFVLKNRVSGAALPEIVLLDEREKEYDEAVWPFHHETLLKLEEVLRKGEQALVFNNRLGFANFIQCRACGYTFQDPNTETNLRYFKNKHRLVSMHSDYWIPMPEICPECGNMNLMQKGYGTEKITEVLTKQFPDFKIGRFDRDEIKNFNQLGDTLEKFHQKEIDVLVGTQMLSKGHNFRNVNHVFILGTDSQLNFPDFRSQEKVFQLLMQVCGRAGRYSDHSKVFIQTLNVEADLYQFVRAQDTNGFYEHELGYRKTLTYPPFAHIAAIYVSHRFRDKLENTCRQIEQILNGIAEKNQLKIDIWGPTPLVIEKRAGQFTWCFQLKGPNRKELHQLINGFEHFYQSQSGVSVKLDIDPQSVL